MWELVLWELVLWELVLWELVLWELVLWELVLWERNLLRDKGCNQTHRPMNRAPTIKSGLPQEDRILCGGNRVLWELVLWGLVLWERNLLRDRVAARPIAR